MKPRDNLADTPWSCAVRDITIKDTSSSSISIRREARITDKRGQQIAVVTGSLDNVQATAQVMAVAWAYEGYLREFVSKYGKKGFDVEKWKGEVEALLKEVDRRLPRC